MITNAMAPPPCRRPLMSPPAGIMKGMGWWDRSGRHRSGDVCAVPDHGAAGPDPDTGVHVIPGNLSARKSDRFDAAWVRMATTWRPPEAVRWANGNGSAPGTGGLIRSNRSQSISPLTVPCGAGCDILNRRGIPLDAGECKDHDQAAIWNTLARHLSGPEDSGRSSRSGFAGAVDCPYRRD